MGSLGEQVIAGAQQQAQDLGHTVGDAMNAYHVAATTEHARQELEMQKQDQDRNKATWFSAQIDNLQRMEDGPARKLILNSLKSQLPQVYPSANPDNIDMLAARPELTPALSQLSADYVNGKNLQSGGIEQLLSAHGTDFMNRLDKQRDAKLQELGNQMKSEAMSGRVLNAQDNTVLSTVKGIHNNPLLVTLKGQALGMDKGNQVLTPHVAADGTVKQPTWTDLNEYKQDYSANLTGAQVGSDFKLHELGDPVYKQQAANVEAKLKGNQDQPADPKAVAYWQERGRRLSAKLDGQIAAVARTGLSGIDPQYLHNPNIAPALHAAVAPYQDGSWRKNAAALEGVIDSKTGLPAGQDASVAPAATPTAATPIPKAPVRYGATPKEVDVQFEKFLADEAHKQAAQTAGPQ